MSLSKMKIKSLMLKVEAVGEKLITPLLLP